ncbi:MarR family winged helix-turn-helix transcriptional regulator [Alicyclobacillus fastidiosus]|uniref:HTH-type transcriptional regulator SarZ n=2 Tax=Alicyclobacillus fastidiosus TaxID=392011 RepID=A0ABV5AK59_9BACL
MTNTQHSLRERLISDLAYQLLLTQGLSSMIVTQTLSCNQLLVLKKLNECDVVSLTDLCTALKLSPSTITGICDGLEKKACITRHRPLTDRRFVYVSITDCGRECLNQNRNSIVERFALVADRFDDADLAKTVSLLAELNKSLRTDLKGT